MKRVIFYIIIWNCYALGAFSQSYNTFNQKLEGILMSSNLIEDAVKKGFCVIRQNYRLLDPETGNLYGRGNKNEFGVTYSIGVKYPEGFYITDKAVRPWEYDENYNQYRGDKYKPIISSTQVVLINDTLDYQSIEFPDRLQTLIPETVYCLKEDILKDQGFSFFPLQEKNAGWVIWITTQENRDLSKKVDVTYHIYHKNVEMLDGNAAPVSMDVSQIQGRILGGIYVIPEQTSIGQITFHLCGIMVEKENKWLLFFPFEENLPPADGQVKEKRSNGGIPGELTPISSKTEKDNNKKTKDKKKK